MSHRYARWGALHKRHAPQTKHAIQSIRGRKRRAAWRRSARKRGIRPVNYWRINVIFFHFYPCAHTLTGYTKGVSGEDI